jgi:Glycosyl transferase family 11
MLAFNYLGRLGRLGNQMFQYAAVKGIARRKGYNYCIPNHSQVMRDPYNFDVKIEIFHPFKLTHLQPQNIRLLDRGYAPVAEEKHFHFDQLLFDMCPDEISIAGFFQSEKYFKHIEQEIKEDFEFKDEILEPCKDMMSSVENAIALHVRRTDYLQNPNHTTLDLSYYEKALQHFDDSFPVIVFSDDIEWCKNQEIFSGDRFMLSESGDHYVDLCLMTLCDYHIIANSSFSWWGAWLAKNNKEIVAPSKWFGSGNADKETKDLIPESWVVI